MRVLPLEATQPLHFSSYPVNNAIMADISRYIVRRQNAMTLFQVKAYYCSYVE
jgi:hypothetical protein